MITIISGTNRKNSNSAKVARLYQNLIKEKGLASQVLDLAELSSDFVSNMYSNHTQEVEQVIQNYVSDIKHFVFVIPEYNGSFTGAIKLFMDGISPKYFNHKSAMLVGVASGRAGNIVGLSQFTTVLNHVKVEVFSNKVLLSGIDGLLDESGKMTNDNQLKIIENQIDTYKSIHGL
ncbi:MAG: NAD(P)H-dependent oxidoreductase [Flavobacteriales bacterium]